MNRVGGIGHNFWTKLPKWPTRIFFVFLIIFIGADFIANDKPIYCKVKGKTYFPIFKSYSVALGLAKWDPNFVNAEWHTMEYQKVIFPLIPYSPQNLDLKNANCVSPFGPQTVSRGKFWHILGTDNLGRDIASGMIHGVRIAYLVGFGAMFIALFIGLFFGVLAGYFGDDSYIVSRGRFVIMSLFLFLGFIYLIVFPYYNGISFTGLLFIILIFSLLFIGIKMFVNYLEAIKLFKKQMTINWDLILMRLIEIFKSIPGIFFLLAFFAIIEKPKLIYLILILGFLMWPQIARFVRAELLKIRETEYINMAKSLGLKDITIIWNHVLPNAISPVLVTLSFGFASAVLLESTLSFLGIGLPEGTVSWGSILNAARSNFSAWWLAIFPGLAIFISVYIFNRFGDALADNKA